MAINVHKWSYMTIYGNTLSYMWPYMWHCMAMYVHAWPHITPAATHPLGANTGRREQGTKLESHW